MGNRNYLHVESSILSRVELMTFPEATATAIDRDDSSRKLAMLSPGFDD